MTKTYEDWKKEYEAMGDEELLEEYYSSEAWNDPEFAKEDCAQALADVVNIRFPNR